MQYGRCDGIDVCWTNVDAKQTVIRFLGPGLARAELRNPRNEDLELASALQDHLNDNMESHHKLIWIARRNFELHPCKSLLIPESPDCHSVFGGHKTVKLKFDHFGVGHYFREKVTDIAYSGL